MIKGILILGLAGLSVAGMEKPITVHLKEELQQATFVREVLVLGYSDSLLHCSLIDKPDSLFDVDTHMSKPPDDRFKSYAGMPELTMTWPKEGSQVLLVISPRKRISLFAFVEGSDYRFWSPAYTGSVALFEFGDPARALPYGTCVHRSEAGLNTCWDGCLLSRELLADYRKGP